MASIITIAGEKLFAAKAQANEQLDIDTFIFANVPGQDATAPISREEGLPSDYIVHQQIVQQVGRINDNVVVYSTVLDSVTGPFEFNWVGLYSSVNNTLVAINHIPTTPKTVTADGVAGNTLNRNFGIEYSGIADLTGIDVAPETWQLDFTSRLSGVDKLIQNLASDINGKNWFIGDGFKVVERTTLNSFKVLAGTGYVNGLRVELLEDHIIAVDDYPKGVYLEAWFDGDASSVWQPRFNINISNNLDEFTDEHDKKHYITKIAEINQYNNVQDLRKKPTSTEAIKNEIDSHINDGKHNANSIGYRIGDSLDDLQRAAMVYEKTINIKIPTDFSDLNEALNSLSGVSTSGKTEIVIKIESGHRLTKGISQHGRDFSDVRIVSDDEIVYLANDFVGADTSNVPSGILGETPRAPLIFGYRTKLPTLDCIIDMENNHGTGIQMAEAECVVSQGKGIINAGFRGIQVHGRANIYGANFSGSSGIGLRMQQASSCNARSAIFDNCCKTLEQTNSSIYASRGCILEFRGGSAKNSGGFGLIARRSLVNADDADVSGAAKGGIFAESQGANVSFSNGNALNCGSSSAIYAAAGGVICAYAAKLSRPSAPQATINLNGGQIWVNAGTAIDGVTGEEIIIQSSNAKYLNAFFERGCIIFNDGVGTFEIGENELGKFEKKSNGQLKIWTTNVINLDLAPEQWSGQLQLPDLPHPFLNINNVEISVVGRTQVDAGGYRVAVSSWHRLVPNTNEFKVKNEGVELSGDGQNMAIKCIEVRMSVEGTWR